MQALVTLALTSHALSGSPVSRKVWKAMEPLLRQNSEPQTLLDWAEKNLSAIDAEAIKARLEDLSEAEELRNQLAEAGMQLVTIFDETYPQLWNQRLKQTPPLLYACGNLSLLNEPSIGIVGSRDVDEDGSDFARQAANAAVEAGFGVVSGGARGVDQISMAAAFEADGNSVGILADSLAKAIKQRETQRALESGRVCLVSPYSPSAGFQVGNAMARNKLIYASSQATVVVAASEGTGGTWAGAVEALNDSICPVFVRALDPMPAAHRKLAAMGAIEVTSRSDITERLKSPGSLVIQPALL